MLPRWQRLTRGDEYRATVRRGQRRGGSLVTAHVLRRPDDQPTRFGFIVTKQVGGAVVRNTVRRRLKSICAVGMNTLPPGLDVVLRASPAARAAAYADLRADVVRTVGRTVSR